MRERLPAVSGVFYPSDPEELRSMVNNLLAVAKQTQPLPKAMIVPHAGYIYSGQTAAKAYASWLQRQTQIQHIVLLGPAHTEYVRGIAYADVDAFLTPLGSLLQDKELLGLITDLPYVQANNQAHLREHCLEVQWPFCQVVFPGVKILPLIVGQSSEKEVAEVLKRVWGDSRTLIIISTDLSHYLDYDQARHTDHKTCKAIEVLDPQGVEHPSACGYFPLRGFLYYASQIGLRGRLMDYRNSGDTAGSKDRVVGYAAYHFYENFQFKFYCGEDLLYLAKAALRCWVEEQRQLMALEQLQNDYLKMRAATFVTIKNQNRLRGCRGNLLAVDPIGKNVIANACAAGFADSRFPAVTEDELEDLDLSISILSPLHPLQFSNEQELKKLVRQDIDGLYLRSGPYQATFLPSVWEEIHDKDLFFAHLKEKMGLSASYWSADVEAWSYTTELLSPFAPASRDRG